jgi:large subunit ribosomal protein L18e
MKSKTKIETQIKKKINKELVDTIILAKKSEAWREVASILSGSRRNRKVVNLDQLNKVEKAETIIVPGKVLSQGEITKKIKVAALTFSEKAKEKLLKAGCEVVLLEEEIKKNKDAKGVIVLR